MKIVVLAGGLSPERDVSLTSGSLIANALIENGHQVLLLDLYKGLDAPVQADLTDLCLDSASPQRYHYAIPSEAPDLAALKQASTNGDSLIGPQVIDLCQQADLVFLALHGAEGENGKVQALFDLYSIRYTGSGYIGSLLAMDKDLAKRMLVQGGVPTPEWVLLDLAQGGTHKAPVAIGFPCVVKPCSSGSSVGVSIVNDEAEFQAALALASQYESQILVEKMIKGREFSIGILDGEALPVIEIIPKTRFYDYENKYQAGMTEEVCPAELDPAVSQRMQAFAVKAHHALRLGFYSRIDFLLDSQGEMFCLEANTLPGMTPTSLLPQEAQAVGISYGQLCERIANSALTD